MPPTTGDEDQSAQCYVYYRGVKNFMLLHLAMGQQTRQEFHNLLWQFHKSTFFLLKYIRIMNFICISRWRSLYILNAKLVRYTPDINI